MEKLYYASPEMWLSSKSIMSELETAAGFSIESSPEAA